MRTQLFLASLAVPLLAPPLPANDPSDPDELPVAPIATALASVSEDVRVFNDHLVTLASPFMEGRLPGTRGMEVAKDYVEFYLRRAGLEPAFPVDGGEASFRQPFPLDGVAELRSQSLSIDGTALAAGEDFTALSLGASGSASGPAVYVGYSIVNGPDEYSSYAEGDDLTGKIAVMFRFEPMNAEGRSQWIEEGWSARAGFFGKVRAAANRGAAGIVVVNPPGTADERAASLSPFNMGGATADVPVFMMMPDAAAGMFGGADAMMEKRREADSSGGSVADLGAEIALSCDIAKETITAENVGGLLRGRGPLADELIVVGAHMDHLGMGFFGSNDREAAGKELHPGADDNASGTAGILLIADWLVDAYAELPKEQSLRSILVVAFSAEESGLNGANFYVEHPVVDLDKHALMLNFDMIGRIEKRRLAVEGVGTANGLADLVEPIFERSNLDVQSSRMGGGGSDHMSFWAAGVPALFAIIADMHPDVHTPRDTGDKINRVDAVEAAYLWRDVALAAARHGEPFEFVEQAAPRRGGGRMNIKVRFGIRPGSYEEDLAGVPVESVSEGGAAANGGLLGGDRIVSWDGAEVTDVRSWMELLSEHEPGDAVMVGVVRDGEKLELRCVLQAPGGR
jgi:hypothetical protein